MSFEMSRKHYAEMYGPTTGDAIRLADTSSHSRDASSPARAVSTVPLA